MTSNRYRKNLFTAIVPLIVSVVSGLLVPPFLTRYFTMPIYGFWVLLNSAISIAAIGGLGIDASVSYYLKEAPSRALAVSILRRSTVVTFAVGIAGFLLLLFSGIWGLHFSFLAKFSALPGIDISRVWFVSAVWALLSLQFLPVQGAIIGLGSLHGENLFRAGVSGLPLLLIVLIWFFKLNFEGFVFCSFFGLLIINLGRACYLTYCVYRLPRTNSGLDPEMVALKPLLLKSFGFFVAGLAALVIQNGDSIIIASARNLSDVGEFNLAFRLISLVFGVAMLINNSAYTEINSTKRNIQVYDRLWRLNLLLVSLLVFSTGILLQDFLKVWLNRAEVLPSWQLLLMCIYGFTFTFVNLNTVFANALGASAILARVAVLEAVLHIAFVAFLISSFGLAGVPMGSILALCLSSLSFTRFYLTKYDKSLLVGNMAFRLLIEVVCALLVGSIVLLVQWLNLGVLLNSFLVLSVWATIAMWKRTDIWMLLGGKGGIC